MITKLNPCGCGGEAEMGRGHGYYIECKKCGNRTGNYSTEAAGQAITAWNLAHPLAVTVREIEEMVEMVEGFDPLDSDLYYPQEYMQGVDFGIEQTIDKIKQALTAYVTGKSE